MLSYIGGKSRIGKWIVDYYPQDMETYVETFGGMFWCFYNMDMEKYPNLKRVVYNDFNPLNYNLFQCIQNPTELLKAVEAIPCQQKGEFPTPPEYKELFNQYQSEIFADGFKVNGPDYEVAAKYAYILTSVFSGSKPETSKYIDLKGKYKSKFLTFRDKLRNEKWVEKFLAITHVENMDLQMLLKNTTHQRHISIWTLRLGKLKTIILTMILSVTTMKDLLTYYQKLSLSILYLIMISTFYINGSQRRLMLGSLRTFPKPQVQVVERLNPKGRSY